MNEHPAMISGLSQIAGDYDALICDVWGVVHDGVRPHPAAVEALQRFRAAHGKVVLLSNAPRPPADIALHLEQIGVPADCYDAIVTSGGAAREDIARRTAFGPLALMHLGPERDCNLYSGLDVELVGPDKAALVLCSGLTDDETETVEDYRPTLTALRGRGLTMICANPDLVVPRGGRILYCAGAIARAYEEMGGEVLYYGKPHPAIYKETLAAAGAPGRPLVVGDGLLTDIRGANRAGIDALFVVHGVHKEEIGAETSLENLFAANAVHARAAMTMLAW